IFDRTGKHLLYEIAGDEKRTLVSLDEIPEYLVQATVTAEDRKFYDHNGIDVKGIMRAVFVNITSFDPTGQGGSTITQQLVKNAILTKEKTYTRKMKELILALALERRYEKDEIIQLYLNEIAYGSTNYGVESAARAYFGKSVTDVTIAEAATLAALPQAPTTFLNNPDSLLARRNWILTDMAALGYISNEERDAALLEETPVSLSLTGIKAPHFSLWVKELLEAEFGERTVEQGGLVVTTTLDLEKQEIAEEAVTNNVEARSELYGFNNSGLVALDPKTGDILSMVGSADYFNDDIDGQVNVTLRPLQPGSSFKPIIFAAAFERGYTPNTLLWDTVTTFPTETGPYTPYNYDLSEHGQVTIRKALQGSLNIPAVKALYLVGVQNGLDFAERMGYTTFGNRGNFGLSLVLGGGEVELLEHVNAYAVFANSGVQFEPRAILEVVDRDGTVLTSDEAPKEERIIEANTANQVTNVLSDDSARAYAFGAGGLLTLPGRPAAAKTGTTNDAKDAWALGYTPSLVAGVWTGNTKGTTMNRGAGGSSVAAPIWNEFMRRALEGTPAESFPPAPISLTGKPVLDGSNPTESATIDLLSGKLATEYTPEEYKKELVCGEFQSILTYVDRNDPLGAAPKNPATDPQYSAWETGVSAYLTSEAAEGDEVIADNCELPTEDDDVHTKENQPSLTLESPENDDNIERSFTIDTRVRARRDLARIEWSIDGIIAGSRSYNKSVASTLPSWVSRGEYDLTVTVYDDVGNRDSETVRINVTEAGTFSTLSITNPIHGQIIEYADGDTYNVVIEASDSSELRNLRVTAFNLLTGERITILSKDTVSALTIAPWNIPSEANYLIEVEAEKEGDTVAATPVTTLTRQTLRAPDILESSEPPIDE
ncbi:MAG: PBP1A family penicillin-binding protein, partial [bacterium]|nr:PBP1A family penicillin-binding protein [bacterium]